MRYSIEPKDRIYVKGYGFLSFPKIMDTHLSNKYGQTLLDSTKKSATDAIKIASKRAIQKTAGTTGNLTRNKIADKTTPSKKSLQNASTELHSKTDDNETEITKKDISPEKRQQIIDESRLV